MLFSIENHHFGPFTHTVDILFSHVWRKHETCTPEDWCRWSNTTLPTPTKTTSYTLEEISKVREVFASFANEEFCKHLTLGMTDNANESLHDTIWNFCPQPKYISPQSVRFSTLIAITMFNDGVLSIFGLMSEQNLNPSYTSFRSLCKRV